MIARNIILFILLIVLPDLYIDYRFFRKGRHLHLWQRLLWWMPAAMLLAYTCYLANMPHFIPEKSWLLDAWLFLLGVIVIPKFLFALCSVLGLAHNRYHNANTRLGEYFGVAIAVIVVISFIYGMTVGFSKLEVREVEMRCADLPSAFDGYRIVQFSDAHVGTYSGCRKDILRHAVDMINAQKADAVVFTGDLQNIKPSELYEQSDLLGSLKAKDGVFSVLGNHDYSEYVDLPLKEKIANERSTVALERSFGWQLLLNEHKVVRRGADSLVIAGEENDGLPPFPAKGDLNKTLAGVGDGAFVVLLQHDPSAWRRSILPESKAQVTLSGHTHGGQISLFGFRPTMQKGSEDYGLYESDGRYLYVSSGLGGVVPFRFSMPGEIVVITLKKE